MQALIAHVIQELIRDGNHTVADLMNLGGTLLGRRHVHPAVTSTLKQVKIEGTFPSGTYLVTIDNPIRTDEGDLARALYASFLPVPTNDVFPELPAAHYMARVKAGAVMPMEGRIVLNNNGRRRIRLKVTNTGDRPIQVGSHYHFIEANPALEFDRRRSYGFRLDIASGSSWRFEPGDAKVVNLVEIAGKQIIRGGKNLASGKLDYSRLDEIMERVKAAGYAHVEEEATTDEEIEPWSLSRAFYATTFGPTTGDRVRLGLTDLWIKVEKDYTTYGEECKFGGGKTLREGMGQAAGESHPSTLDVVITNALIVDWTGIYKADIGIKHGIIVAIGKAGNPDVMDGVTPGMVVGSSTDVVAAEGKIITAGGIDTHVHFTSPQQAQESMATGVTTVLGGGTGPT